MKNLIGIFLLPMLLSGCVTTASSGTRTEYEDTMVKIEQDYKDMKVTEDEYIELKNRAERQARAAQENYPESSEQIYP